MAHLSIRLLSPFEVKLDGKRITAFHSDKERALLAYLCLEWQGAHRREKLAGLLWPDYPESAARTNLRTVLANLRKVIGDRPKKGQANSDSNFLFVTRKTIQFNVDSDAWVDALAFQSTVEKSQATVAELEEAVAYYRDAFMAGFSLPDSDMFEEWLILQRERFRRLAFDAHHRMVEAYSNQGEYKRALAHARHMVALDPLRESAQQLLMRLLTYNGQPNQALLQYETYTDLLADEIGVEPLDETTRLYLQIKDGRLTPPKSNRTYKPAFLNECDDTKADRPIFVGREREMARLNLSLEKALAGQGQVIFVIGEPGSGKTALASEFFHRAMETNPDLLAVSGRCNAYTGFGDPYLPFSEILEMLTGAIETRWAGGEIPGEHARRLWQSMPDVLQTLFKNGPALIERLLSGEPLLDRARSGAPDQVIWLMEILGKQKGQKFTPDTLQQIDLFEQYTKTLQKLSWQHPLILLVDDLQWADPGSIALLFHMGRRLSGSRILLIGAYRPEEIAIGRRAESGWERHPSENVIHELQGKYGAVFVDLDKTEFRKFVDAFIDTEPNQLSDDFRDVLCQRTGGNPLFTVELLREMQHRGEIKKDEADRWVAQSPLNWELLPPRVEAIITERISRLPREMKSILSAASIEGQEFTAEVIAQVRGIDVEHVLSCLSGPLARKHHLVQGLDLGWLGDQRLSSYRFSHFLFQKFLYDQLDLVERSILHQSVGTALESLHRKNLEKQALRLAWHFEEAGMMVEATKYLLEAGTRAVRLFGYQEAITHFKHGLNLVKTLPETPKRNLIELSLLLALALPLLAIKGPVTELEQTCRRARQLTRNIEPSEELFQALQGLTSYYTLSLELGKALKFGQDMLNIAGKLERGDLLIIAHHLISSVYFYLGRASDFLETQKRMMALYEDERERILENQFGFFTVGEAFSHGGWALWHLGYPEQSKHKIEALLALVERIDHPCFQAEAYMNAAFSFWNRRQVTEAREVAEKAIAISRQHSYSFSLGGGLGIMGWVLGEEGKLDKGIEIILEGLAVLKDSSSRLIYQHLLMLLAGAYLKAEKAAEGLAVINESSALIDKTDFWLHKPEIYRLKGELILLKKGLEAQAEMSFKHAIEIAKEQKAKSWELRAVMSLCRLWKRQGKIDQARVQLTEIYDWFTEGFAMPDLQEAKALLDAVS